MVISGFSLVISLCGAYTLTSFSKYFYVFFSILSFVPLRVDVYFSSFLLMVIFAFPFCVHIYIAVSFVFLGLIFCGLVSILCVYAVLIFCVLEIHFRNLFGLFFNKYVGSHVC